MDHRLAGAGDATGAVEIGILDYPVRGVTYCHTQLPRSVGMSVGNIGCDIVQRPTCRWPPDQWEISDARRGREWPASQPLLCRAECRARSMPLHARPWRETTHHKRQTPDSSRGSTQWGSGRSYNQTTRITRKIKSIPVYKRFHRLANWRPNF